MQDISAVSNRQAVDFGGSNLAAVSSPADEARFQQALGGSQPDPAETLKLERTQTTLSSVSASAANGERRLEDFDSFISEAHAQKLSAHNANTTWSVNRESNTIDLDNGWRISLREASSELLLEKVGDDGEIEKATRIWGDPHIDVGNDGTNDADFWKDTTLALKDGTKITIGTRGRPGTNMTFSDKLTITKGHQAIQVTGLMGGEDALAIGDVTTNGQEVDDATNDGWMMYEEHGDKWSVEGYNFIGDDIPFKKFAIEEKTRETAWGTVNYDPGQVIGKGSSMSASMVNFLKAEGIEWDDADNDGVLSESEWETLAEDIGRQKEAVEFELQHKLTLMAGMIQQFADTLDKVEDSDADTGDSAGNGSGAAGGGAK